MKKIYFIILNYNTKIETIKCIESIRRLKDIDAKKHIIIIDNFSPDQSFTDLEEYYFNDKDVELYRMEENIGFSKANNYGYKLVRERKDAEFCIVCNSDIDFVQSDFLICMKKEYDRSHFYICGPDVYCIRGKKPYHQSPMYPFEWKERYVKVYLQYCETTYKKLKKEIKAGDLGILLQWSFWRLWEKFSTATLYRSYRRNRQEDVPVHGSCIILSRDFLTGEEVVFWPEINFYGEERLLYLRMKKKNYKIVYNPQMLIHHLQGKATASIKNVKQKNLFRLENLLIGARTYLEELDK